MADSEHKKIVAYAPFKTFLAAVEGFEHATIPHQIDTSVWPTYSGAIKSQLLGSFKFLGLIDDMGKPTPVLKSLVEDKANRKTNLRKIIETSYPKIVSAGLQKMTPKSFDELMQEYGMGGSTHQKVTSFFLQAAKYTDLPMSPLLGKRRRTPGTRRSRAGETRGNGTEVAGSLPPSPVVTAGSTKTIEMRNGVRLSLAVSVDLFAMVAEDRSFVLGLLEKLEEYESKKTPSA
jgi:hypothetical protein